MWERESYAYYFRSVEFEWGRVCKENSFIILGVVSLNKEEFIRGNMLLFLN